MQARLVLSFASSVLLCYELVFFDKAKSCVVLKDTVFH
jgi:hypothetical protein